MLTINEMQDDVIAVYGFEHPLTIYFFTVCEDCKDLFALNSLYAEIMASLLCSDEW